MGRCRDLLRAYREHQVISGDPRETLLLLYDLARRACREQDRRRAIPALEELVGSLDLSRGETARGLLALYEYMLRRIRENEWEEATAMLDELRATWAQALQGEGGGGRRRPGDGASSAPEAASETA